MDSRNDAQQQETRQETRDVAEWARPAYEAVWQDYVAAGAPYGRTFDGLMRWVLEQVQANRAAYERSHEQAQKPARTGLAGVFAALAAMFRAWRTHRA